MPALVVLMGAIGDGALPTPGGPDQEIRNARHPALAYVQALRRPAERRAAGVCLAEGPHLVREALEAGLRPLVAFATPRWMAEGDGRDLVPVLVERLPGPTEGRAAAPKGFHHTAESAFRRLSGTQTPQGILAVFALPETGPPEAPSWSLVLDGVQDPGNVGTLARALLAFGGARSLLLTGHGTADPFGEKALRASAGAAFRLSHRHAPADGLVAALSSLQDRGVTLCSLQPRGGTSLRQADLRPPLALVVGGEGAGVSAAVQAVCRPLTVPMPGPAESLNAALAGAIALYEAAGRPPSA